MDIRGKFATYSFLQFLTYSLHIRFNTYLVHIHNVIVINVKRICSEYVRNCKEKETMMMAGTQRTKRICNEYVANMPETSKRRKP